METNVKEELDSLRSQIKKLQADVTKVTQLFNITNKRLVLATKQLRTAKVDISNLKHSVSSIKTTKTTR